MTHDGRGRRGKKKGKVFLGPRPKKDRILDVRGLVSLVQVRILPEDPNPSVPVNFFRRKGKV